MTKESLTKVGSNNESTTISIELLSKMTGFPVEMITQEIFSGRNSLDEVSMDELRSAMLAYIDASLLIDQNK